MTRDLSGATVALLVAALTALGCGDECSRTSYGLDAGTSRIAHFDGEEWQVVDRGSFGALETVWGSGRDDVWASGRWPGANVRWNGREWRASDRGLYGATSIWGSGPDDVWAADFLGLRHWDDGHYWKEVELSGPSIPPTHGSIFKKVWGLAANDVWLLDGLVHWDGAVFSLTTSVFPGPLVDIWGSASDDIWAVGFPVSGQSTTVLHWDGAGWSSVVLSDTRAVWLMSVWGSGPTDVWAAGDALFHWDGTTWTEVTTGETAHLYGPIWGTAADDVWLVAAVGPCDTRRVLRWDGASWTRAARFDWRPTAFWGSAGDDVWLVGYDFPK